jgi:hypothetical protein
MPRSSVAKHGSTEGLRAPFRLCRPRLRRAGRQPFVRQPRRGPAVSALLPIRVEGERREPGGGLWRTDPPLRGAESARRRFEVSPRASASSVSAQAQNDRSFPQTALPCAHGSPGASREAPLLHPRRHNDLGSRRDPSSAGCCMCAERVIRLMRPTRSGETLSPRAHRLPRPSCVRVP